MTSAAAPVVVTVFVDAVDLGAGDTLNVTNTNLVVAGMLNLGNGTLNVGSESSVTCAEFIGGEGGSAELNGNMVVLGDFTANGCSFNVTKNGVLKVVGNIVLSAQTLIALEMADTNRTLISSGGTLTIAGSLVMRIIQSLFPELLLRSRRAVSRSDGVVTQSFPVASFASSNGNFATVNVSLAPSQCVEHVGPDTVNYGPSTASLSVTLQVNGNNAGCAAQGGGGLSTGVIVGIAIACVVVAIVAITLLVVYWRHYERKQAVARVRGHYATDFAHEIASLPKPK